MARNSASIEEANKSLSIWLYIVSLHLVKDLTKRDKPKGWYMNERLRYIYESKGEDKHTRIASFPFLHLPQVEIKKLYKFTYKKKRSVNNEQTHSIKPKQLDKESLNLLILDSQELTQSNQGDQRTYIRSDPDGLHLFTEKESIT